LVAGHAGGYGGSRRRSVKFGIIPFALTVQDVWLYDSVQSGSYIGSSPALLLFFIVVLLARQAIRKPTILGEIYGPLAQMTSADFHAFADESRFLSCCSIWASTKNIGT
jgi:hypothetical protein